jgi:hypothetical protein
MGRSLPILQKAPRRSERIKEKFNEKSTGEIEYGGNNVVLIKACRTATRSEIIRGVGDNRFPAESTEAIDV